MTTHGDPAATQAPIALRIDGEVAELVLDRADKRNAMSVPMWEALPGLVARADADDAVKVIVLRGEGPHFCAGADIAEFGAQRSTPEAAQAYNERIEAATAALVGATKPSIAVIRGYCIGAGCELALSCDLRLAADDATFAITPATLGIVLGYGSTRRLVEVVGPSFAKYLLLSANRVTAQEAHRVRMVDRLVASDDLDGAARELAGVIGGRAQVSVRGAKRLVDKAVAGVPVDDADARRIPLEAVTSADYAEGVAAFLEKRPARFG